MHDLSCFAFLLLSGLGIKFMVVLVQGRYSYSLAVFYQICEGLGQFKNVESFGNRSQHEVDNVSCTRACHVAWQIEFLRFFILKISNPM